MLEWKTNQKKKRKNFYITHKVSFSCSEKAQKPKAHVMSCDFNEKKKN